LQNAKAGVTVAQANIASARAAVATAQSNVESAKIRSWKATQDFNRYSNLLKDKAVTLQQFDAVKAEKEGMDAQLSSVVKQQSATSAQLQAIEKQVDVSLSAVAQREADVAFAKLQLSYCNVIAPSSGFASRKNIQPGQLVNAGAPLFAIVSDSGVYVTANFKETQLEKMEKGQEVEVEVDAFPHEKIKANIVSFSAATGAKFSLLPPDNATGNFVKVVQRVPVKIVFSKKSTIVPKLRPGMSVKVSVHID
jgi:membrane fusion protein (multidrug efflux system)